MRTRSFLLRSLCLSPFVVLNLTGCGGGEDDVASGGGATAGASGSAAAGKGGSAGKAGTGGSGTAGKAGAGGAGAAGKAGASGAGAAGKAGAAGTGGKAGTGGQAGAAGKGGASGQGGGAGKSGQGGAAGASGQGGSAGKAGAAGVGGAAGQGGSAGVGGVGGGGGGSCVAASECPGSDNECQQRTCTAGVCGIAFTAAGTETSSPVAGDCKRSQCDGKGVIESVLDASDPQDDQNICTTDLCENGTTVHTPVPAGTTCGALVCDAVGQCAGCATANDCPGQDDECKTRTCTVGVCGFAFAPSGTSVAQQKDGDCQTAQCDGNGATVMVAEPNDRPVDGNECTDDVCIGSAASNPPSASGANCANGGVVCNGASACVQCLDDSACPASPNLCQTAVCNAGVCGFANVAPGFPVGPQNAGDCIEKQCDGNGNLAIVNVVDIRDDGKICTTDTCAVGLPVHTPVATGTACGPSQLCNAAGDCVGCLAASDCAGVDDECRQRTCTAGVCGFAFTASGTPVAAQIAGDCSANRCDGAGNIVNEVDDADVPVDANQCTVDACSGGVGSNLPASAGAACSQNGGSVCNGTASCVECLSAATCPGFDTVCGTRTCVAGVCGTSFAAAGTVVGTPVVGDCKQVQCDGAGGVATVAQAGDLPVDGNQCTADICSGTEPSNPTQPANTACSQNGGAFCNASAACVECNVGAQCTSGVCTAGGTCAAASCTDNVKNGAESDTDCGGDTCGKCAATKTCGVGADCFSGTCTGGVCQRLAVASTAPADGATGVLTSSTIAVTFSGVVAPASLTVQANPGACSGSLQVSTDNFATCIGLSSLTFSVGNTVATVAPSPALSYGSVYKVRVTTAAQDPGGQGLASAYTSTTGFTTNTLTPATCTTAAKGALVISQVYGGGGNAGAPYRADFVELHNRSSVAISVTGFSVQYASTSGNFNSVVNLTGTVPAGGYYLVQIGAVGSTGANLPTPDASTNSFAVATADAKVALVSSTTALGASCAGATVLDLVGFGSASCSEGTAAPAGTNTTGVLRAAAGCTDTGNNAADFVAAAPTPRNTSSAAVPCACGAQTTVNESAQVDEIEYCNLQFPVSLTAAPGATTDPIFARVFQTGVTSPAGAPAGLVGQIGYGPLSANPENQAGWTWVNATWNVQSGNDDEFRATLTAPAAGTYKYGSRFSRDGVNWTYCDLNGAGKNDPLTFEITQLPTLTVSP